MRSWLTIIVLLLLAALCRAGWLDYSEHGNIVPERVVDSLKTPKSLLPDFSAMEMPELPDVVPDSGPKPTQDERELLVERLTHELVNEARASTGLPELEYDERLAEIARNHSQDMLETGFFSHRNTKGEGPTQRAERQGYHCRKDYGFAYSIGVAENIFSGDGYNGLWMKPADLAQVAMDSWMGSSGHRANILDTSYSKEGIGVAIGRGLLHFTQKFC